MRLFLLAMTIVMAISFAGSAAEMDAKKEGDVPRGRWVIVSINGAGLMLSEAEAKKRPVQEGMSFEDGTLKRFRGDMTIDEWEFSIDAAKTPGHIDFVLPEKYLIREVLFLQYLQIGVRFVRPVHIL